MHRTVRMLGILIDLQRGATTLGQLAAKYECSRKTIQRDIAGLVDLGFPVLSASGASGGIWLDPAWTLAPMNLTEAEIETAILALEHSTHLPAAGQTLEKIRRATKPEYFDAVAASPQRPRVSQSSAASLPAGIEQLRNVMAREIWCRIDYSDGSNPGWRLILPTALRILEGRWYVRAIDERSREGRTFRIDRIHDVVPALAPAEANQIIASARSRPDYQSETYPEVIVELTPSGVEFCRDHSHFYRHVSENTLRFRCPPGEYPYLARELLRMGTDCRVVAPPGLVESLRELLLKLSRHIGINVDTTVS